MGRGKQNRKKKLEVTTKNIEKEKVKSKKRKLNHPKMLEEDRPKKIKKSKTHKRKSRKHKKIDP